jgi:WXG100 family type VII secretion target
VTHDPTHDPTTGLDHVRFTAGVDALAARAEEMAHARSEVGAAVAELLAGWRGPAADRFAALWEEWCSGADDVVGALAGGVAALRLAHQDLTAADAAVGARHDRLAGRLG